MSITEITYSEPSTSNSSNLLQKYSHTLAKKLFATLFVINNQNAYILISRGKDKLIFRTLKVWNNKKLIFFFKKG